MTSIHSQADAIDPRRIPAAWLWAVAAAWAMAVVAAD